MYTKEGLENGIVNCRANIKVLEKAIVDERNTIKEYRLMMESIDIADEKKAEAEANVHVEVDSGNTN